MSTELAKVRGRLVADNGELGQEVELSLVRFYGGDNDGISLRINLEVPGMYKDYIQWDFRACQNFVEVAGDMTKFALILGFSMTSVIVRNSEFLTFFAMVRDEVVNYKSPSSRSVGPRPLYEIAREIRKDWKNVYFGAVPYLQAMGSLNSINDNYGLDSAESIVIYFLSNAATWRGETAKRIKAELKSMAKRK